MAAKDEKRDHQYKQYLKEKHASFGVKPEIVKDIVLKAIGVELDNLERVVAGEVNEVYDAQTSEGRCIVRISRGKETRFLAEKWALDKAREAGVPAPNMFFVDEVMDNGKKLKVCVENKLPGVAMNELVEQDKLNDEQIEQINLEAGEILARIHSVIPQGFGKLYEGGMGSKKTWADYMLKHYNDKRNDELYTFAEKVGISRDQIDKAIDILKDHEYIYKTVTPHLLHCDFGPKHFLITDGQITGIIDFENCMSGDPVYDFAWKNYFGEDTLKEGYLKLAELPDDYELRVKLYGLRIGIDLIWWYVAENHTTGMAHAKKKMEELLKYFES
ncbi:MAG: aminoglycoside phosphotransferase family protein [Patescibacteria group bacterium]